MNRSMDNLEQLSDSELRHRLLQYGFPNLPVTDTTRKILIKKLRNHINNEKTKLRRDAKLIARYSSDEETSDIDSSKKRKNDKFPVTVMVTSTTSTISPATRDRSTIFNDDLPPPTSPGISRKNISASSLSSSPIGMRTNISNNYSFPTHSSFSSVASTSSLKQKPSKITIYVPPPIIATDTDEDSDYCNQKSLKLAKTLRASTSQQASLQRTTCNTHDSWSEQNRYTPLMERSSKDSSHSLSSSPVLNGSSTTSDSPYVSDFTRRLLNLRGETIRDSIYNKNNENRIRLSPSQLQPLPYSPYHHHISSVSPDPAEIVHQQPEPRSEYNISPSAAFSNLLNRLDEQYGVKQTLIPCILLSLLVIFFAMVAFMYVTISPDLVNTINEDTAIYTLCIPINQHINEQQQQQQNDNESEIKDAISISNPGVNCIEKSSINNALELLKLITPELQKRAEINKCVDNKSPYALSIRETINLWQQKNKNSIDLHSILKIIYNLEYLIEKNPQWKIIHTDLNGNQLKFEQIIHSRINQQYHYTINFSVINPKLPLTCSLYNKLQRFFFVISICGISLLTFSMIYLIYRLIINYQQSKKDMITNFIDEIINTLMRQAATNPERSAIVVIHLRDKLIPLHKRKKMEWAWNEAIKFLEQNESRIQFDLFTRNGEEVKLMKWIDTIALNNFERYGTRFQQQQQQQQQQQYKKWHSPAFDKTNKIANPPTPCLKIRQMFDKFESNNPNLKQIIQDAILEKVGPQCKIYDIQLDKATCCVYVRCATVNDAGIVHNEINGWWFDKRLVSIKFLRLERYLNRFPKSSSGPQCLRPSNTQNLSMSLQCSNNYNTINDDDIEDDIDEDDDDN